MIIALAIGEKQCRQSINHLKLNIQVVSRYDYDY